MSCAWLTIMIARRCVSTSLLYVVRGYLSFNIRGAAVQHGDVRPPLGRRDHEVLELAALAARLDYCVARGLCIAEGKCYYSLPFDSPIENLHINENGEE